MVYQHPVFTARKLVMELNFDLEKIIYHSLIITVSASATKMEGARIG